MAGYRTIKGDQLFYDKDIEGLSDSAYYLIGFCFFGPDRTIFGVRRFTLPGVLAPMDSRARGVCSSARWPAAKGHGGCLLRSLRGRRCPACCGTRMCGKTPTPRTRPTSACRTRSSTYCGRPGSLIEHLPRPGLHYPLAPERKISLFCGFNL